MSNFSEIVTAYIKNTLQQEKFNSVAIISIKNDRKLDIKNLMTAFTSVKAEEKKCLIIIIKTD